MQPTPVQWFSFTTIFIVINYVMIGIVGMIISSALILFYLSICNPVKFSRNIKQNDFIIYILGVIVIGSLAIPYLYYFSRIHLALDATSLPLAGQAAQRVIWAYFGPAPSTEPQNTAAQVLAGSYVINTLLVGIAFPALAHSIKYNLDVDGTLKQLKGKRVSYKIYAIILVLLPSTQLRLYTLETGALNAKELFDVLSHKAIFSGCAIYISSTLCLCSLYICFRLSRSRTVSVVPND